MVSWLQQFLQLGGLEVLLTLLNGLEVKQKYVGLSENVYAFAELALLIQKDHKGPVCYL
jgi:hypothetical protein